MRPRDVILAAVATFIAWGYLTHWQPKLHYLPYAFVAGVLTTFALLAWLVFTTSWNKKQRNGGEVNYGPRHAAFLSPEKWKAEREALDKRNMYMMEPIYPASFVISDSIDVLIGLILRDFVKSWYGSISKSPTFVNEVDKAVRAALGKIREHILAVDMVETVVSRMIPLITDHLHASYEAERVVRGRKLSRNITDSEELDLAIAAKYKEGRLHPAASMAYSNTKPIQQQHLRSIVTRLLPKVMPASMLTSSAVNVLIKEIVSCAVLSPVMQMLADPDIWNQLMEGYVRSLRHDYWPDANLTRDEAYCRKGRQFVSFVLRLMNTPHHRRRNPRMFSFRSWRLATTSEDSKGLYGQLGRRILSRTHGVFVVRSPVNSGRTRWLKGKILSIFAGWKQLGRY